MKIFFLLFSILFSPIQLNKLEAKEFIDNTHDLKNEEIQKDTVLTQILDQENELTFYIANQLTITEENINLSKEKKDSLHNYLKENKQIKLNRDQLEYFLDFTLDELEFLPVISKSLTLTPKLQEEKFEIDINNGEEFKLRYEKEKGIISLERIQVLLNGVKINTSQKIKFKEPYTFEFIAKQSGKIEIIIQNFGILPQKGNIDVSLKKTKPKLRIDKIVENQIQRKTIPKLEKDTIFSTLIEEDFRIGEKINNKVTNILSKEIDLQPYKEILGLSIFYYPPSEKEKFKISRRETFREDPLEDFSIKEITGNSYSYLPEYEIDTMDISLLDNLSKTIWSSSLTKNHPSWRISPNSKKNYIFLSLQDKTPPKSLQIKFTNFTRLYEIEVGLKLMIIYLQEFSVNKEIEITETEETYILTLL